MKRPIHATPYFFLFLFFVLCQTTNAQTTYTWTGASSNSWNTPGNWSPAGVPGAADNVVMVTAGNLCAMNANTAINNFKLTSGILDMAGYTLSVNGTTATFTAGSVQNGTFAVTGATTTSFGNGPVSMNCTVAITTSAITLRGTTFQRQVTITKTGATNDGCYGANVFNDATTINNAGSGQIVFGTNSPDLFNAAVTFNNTGSSNIYIAHNTMNNIFQGVATFNNAPSSTGTIYISQSGTSSALFNNNIIVSSTSGSGVSFGNSSTTSCTLAATRTISIGAGGFSTGTLQFRQFTQTGATAQNLTLTGSANLTIGSASSFDGKLTASSPTLFLNGGTFNDSTDFTKTGSTGDYSTGGNVFNGVSKITNSGSNFLVLGNNNPDIWNKDVIFTANGSERVLPCWNSAGNQFNGNIYVNSSASGVQFCGGSTATATLAATRTINVGSGGFSSGTLQLRGFRQTGATPQIITLTGSGNLTFGPSASFDGSVTASSPTLLLNGCTFNGTTDLTKTGSTGDWGSGGNVFNGVSNITNSGSSYLLLGSNNPDIWNNDVTFTNNGTERLLPCWSSAGNQFNGNIFVNTSGSPQGIQFCGGNATATATLAAARTIKPGAIGLTAGYLQLRQFTQLGSDSITITATGSSAIYLGPSSNFGGVVTISAPDIWAQGATYNSPAFFTKTGGSSNHNNQQQNIFNSTCTIDQQSNTGYFMLGFNSNDLFNDDITITASGKGGIYLGWSSGTGTPTLAAGKTINIGASGFNAGFLSLNTFTQLGNAPMNLNFSGTSAIYFARNSTIGGDLTTNSSDIYFNGATFNGQVNTTRNGFTSNYGSGGNTFQDSATFNNIAGGALIFGNGTPDIWNKAASFNSSAGFIGAGWSSGGNQFNGNIYVSSTGSSGGIYFCQNSSSSATLAAGYTIQVGAGGFSAGALTLRQLTQLGNVPINLNLTGSNTLLQMGASSTIGGDFTAISPRVLLTSTVFNGAANFTKTGATGEWSFGGNTFNSTCTINHQGAGYFGFANGAPDIFNGDAYVNNNSTERVIFGNNPVGNQFNGNIIVTQIGSSQGIAFGWSSTTDITLAAGKTISVGSAGFNTGYLQLMRFTQLGNAPVSLPLTGTSALYFGPTSTFGGDLTSTSGALYFNGCTFNGVVNSTKTGTTSDGSYGNNIFNKPATMTNAGAGNLQFGNNSKDQFMDSATFNNTGSSSIYVAQNSPGNVFGGITTFNNSPSGNGQIYVSSYSTGTLFNERILVSSTSGQGVQFCTGSNSATAILASGKTIGVGGAFSAGTLLLRQFTQTGGMPQGLTLTGTGNLVFGPSSAFGGNVTAVSPSLYFNGCTFDGTVAATKNGTTNDASSGNNIFNAPFTATNVGSGYFMMGNGNPDLWQSTAVFNNQSPAQHMYIAYNSAGNAFNGNVTFNNQPGTTGAWIYANTYGVNTQYNGNVSVVNVNGSGVYFGNNSGTAVLANGRIISVGAGGFNSGGLIFRNFTQSGGAAQSITTTGTSTIQYGNNASFDAPVTSSSPGLLFSSATFNGSVNCTKTGASNDQSPGNNIFNGVSTFTNNGTGYLMMTNSSPDAYNNDISFVQNNTGVVYPNYNNNSSYTGSITVTSPSATAITFGAGNGTSTLSGSALQNLNATSGTPTPVFARLVIANAAGVTLNTTSVNVSKTLTMTSGLFNTTTTRILTMLNASTTTSGDALSTSYVNGPMRYQKSGSGVSTLNFPIGTSPDCRPVVLTVNHSSGTLYTYQAQLFNVSAESLGYAYPLSVDVVSRVHYYTIARTDASGTSQPTAGLSGNQTVQIYFGLNDYVTNGGTLTVVKNTYNNPTQWIDIGGAGGPIYNAGGNLTGSITSTSAPTAFNSFSTFALGDRIGGGNVLPIELLYFNARPANGGVGLTWATSSESNNSYFTVERSKDGVNFESVEKVASAALNGNSDKQLNYTGYDAQPYSGMSYYRLKQTDLDGHETYSKIAAVSFDKNSALSVYPNPTRGQVFVSGISSSLSTVKIEWYDAGGKLLSQESASVAGGIAILNPRFSNGIYLLKIITSEGHFTFQQVIIMK